MDGERQDYAIGYGKPPAETQFQKGQSGNPSGRPRGTKSLRALLGEALSRPSRLSNPDGSWMTQAEAIFMMLVAQASGPDLKAKKLLFDILVKLQHSDIFSGGRSLPEIQLDDSTDAREQVEAELRRGVAYCGDAADG